HALLSREGVLPPETGERGLLYAAGLERIDRAPPGHAGAGDPSARGGAPERLRGGDPERRGLHDARPRGAALVLEALRHPHRRRDARPAMDRALALPPLLRLALQLEIGRRHGAALGGATLVPVQPAGSARLRGRCG